MGWMWADEIGIEWLFATQNNTHTHTQFWEVWDGGKDEERCWMFPEEDRQESQGQSKKQMGRIGRKRRLVMCLRESWEAGWEALPSYPSCG